MHEYLKKLLPLKRRSFMHAGLTGSVFSGGNARGPVVVLQHGLTGDHRGLIPLAFELSSDYHVFLTELPGHGQSPLPHSPALASLSNWFAAALASIAPAPVVLAHSFGCSVALRTLAAHPASMARCVLINPVPRMAGHVRAYQWVGNRLPYAISRRVDAVAVFQKLKMQLMFERKEKAEALAELFLPKIGAFDREHAALYLRLGEQVRRDNVYQDPALNWAHVAAITGPRDSFVSERTRQTLAHLVGAHKYSAVPRTGHLTPIEAPEETAEAVRQLLIG